jgi:hypothetical protein
MWQWRRMQIGERDDAVSIRSAVQQREKAVLATGDKGDHVQPVRPG